MSQLKYWIYHFKNKDEDGHDICDKSIFQRLNETLNETKV